MTIFGASAMVVLFVTTFGLLIAGRLSPAQRTPALTFENCALPDVEGQVLCATFNVPEDRNRPERRIPLNIAVMKATGSAGKPDPIVPLQGGPGQGSVQMAAFFARSLATLRADRDIVLIDARGTGRSSPLRCDIATPEAFQSRDLLPPATIEACRQMHERQADLRMYTTGAIAGDLDEVRRAMGIQQWNLYGTSYGTRLAQEYIRRFGAHVRTVSLKGIVPPSLTIPLPYARDAQTALEATFDPATRQQLGAVLARLRDQPVTATQEATRVTISEGVFAETVRHFLYNPGSTPNALRMIQSAAADDFGPAAVAVVRLRRNFSTDIALGLFLSVTCAEDIPRIDPKAIEPAARGTFLGTFRLSQQIEACRHWKAGARTPDASTPVVSDVPALLFSGDLDPVTPPRYGDEVIRTLRKGKHIVLKRHGHAMGTAAPCIASIMKQFIDRGTVADIDISCVE